MVYLDRVGLGFIEICFGDVRVGLKFIRGWFKVYVGLIYGYLWCV
jgi:hypothetical protein